MAKTLENLQLCERTNPSAGESPALFVYKNSTCKADGRGEYLPWPTHETTSRVTASVTYANMRERKLVVCGSAYSGHVPIPACPEDSDCNQS